MTNWFILPKYHTLRPVEQWVMLHAAPGLTAPLVLHLGLVVALTVYQVLQADEEQVQLVHHHYSLLRWHLLELFSFLQRVWLLAHVLPHAAGHSALWAAGRLLTDSQHSLRPSEVASAGWLADWPGSPWSSGCNLDGHHPCCLLCWPTWRSPGTGSESAWSQLAGPGCWMLNRSALVQHLVCSECCHFSYISRRLFWCSTMGSIPASSTMSKVWISRSRNSSRAQ